MEQLIWCCLQGAEGRWGQGSRPIVLALSNPSEVAECTAQQAYDWSEGRAVYASGTVFEPFQTKDGLNVPSQANNSLIFPGMLACFAVEADVCKHHSTDCVSAFARRDHSTSNHCARREQEPRSFKNHASFQTTPMSGNRMQLSSCSICFITRIVTVQCSFHACHVRPVKLFGRSYIADAILCSLQELGWVA